MLECFKRGLIWRGLVHDLSKYFPSEFFPYARFFYSTDKKPRRDSTGYYKPTNTGNLKFDRAWLKHTRRNKHHWQYWALADDYEGNALFDMPDKYILEMFCDWLGAGRAQGYESGSVDDWYKSNGPKLQLSKKTRAKIENILEKHALTYNKPRSRKNH